MKKTKAQFKTDHLEKLPKPNPNHVDSTAAPKPEAPPLTSNTRASKQEGNPKLLGAKSKNGDNIETILYFDTNEHEITVFILGSIDIRSLDNKYVTKPTKKKYTIETKATDLLLNQLGTRPPQPAQIEPIAIELQATTRSRDCKSKARKLSPAQDGGDDIEAAGQVKNVYQQQHRRCKSDE